MNKQLDNDTFILPLLTMAILELFYNEEKKHTKNSMYIVRRASSSLFILGYSQTEIDLCISRNEIRKRDLRIKRAVNLLATEKAK